METHLSRIFYEQFPFLFSLQILNPYVILLG